MIRSVITGTGSALPAKCVTNADLAAKVDTSDEWIVERTGIRQRYIADDSETTSSLATVAARNALDAAGIDAGEIGLIVLATATPDHTFPATATQVQAAIQPNSRTARSVAAGASLSMCRRSVRASSTRSPQPIRCCARAWPARRW